MSDTSAEPRRIIPALGPFYDNTRDLSYLIVRLTAGGMLFVHGMQKMIGASIAGFAANSLARRGIEPSVPLAYAVFFLETIGALCIILGLFTRVFALAIGIGLVLVQNEKTATFERAIEGLLDITLRLIGLVIRLAPIAVACFMFNLTALLGVDLLVRLGAFVGTVIGALLFQLLVVYSLAILLTTGKSPLVFFRGIQEAMVMAFSTASSNATLPTSLSVAEHQLKLPRKVARFVLTIGATANQNGTAMFEGVTVIFLAQFFSVDLSLGQQATVMAICILGGIGTAGVPAGSLPVIALILGMVGVPPVAIGIVLGVDRFLDMCRTMLNVSGDLAIATMVAGRDPDAPSQSGTPCPT